MKVPTHHLVPAGTYALGDPSYVVPDELWGVLTRDADYFEQPIGHVTYGGTQHRVLAFRTAHGDGCYKGSDGHDYCVDSGLIGLVPRALVRADSYPRPHFVTFRVDAVCYASRGRLYFGDISINTDI